MTFEYMDTWDLQKIFWIQVTVGSDWKPVQQFGIIGNYMPTMVFITSYIPFHPTKGIHLRWVCSIFGFRVLILVETFTEESIIFLKWNLCVVKMAMGYTFTRMENGVALLWEIAFYLSFLSPATSKYTAHICSEIGSRL